MAKERRGSTAQSRRKPCAIQALGFLAGDPERLGAFLAATGIGPESIRAAAARAALPRRRARPLSRQRAAAARLRQPCRASTRRSVERAQARPRAAAPGSARCRDLARLLPRLPRRRRRRARAARPAARRASLRHARARHAHDRACRLRRLLRHDREARRPVARRQAADRRRRQARRGLDRLLCRAHLRRALGDADVRGAQALSRTPPSCRPTWRNTRASAARCAR